MTFTVKAGATPLEGAVLSFTGTSAKGTDISGNYVAQAKRTTNASGQCVVPLPDSATNAYQFTIADVAVGGKNYSMSNKAGVPFTVNSSSTTQTYTSMTEVSNAYPIRVKVFDKSGAAVDLTGANVKFGVSASPVDVSSSIANNEVSFTTASSGSGLVLQLSNLKGFRNITGATTQINVTPNSGSTTQATISKGDCTASTASVTIETDETGQYIKLVPTRSVTNVTIPLPVPMVNGAPITSDAAKKMQLTFTPHDKASESLKKEVGAGVVVSGSAITVTDAAAKAADVLAGTITARAPLPDGAYSMAIGGPGFDSKTLPVTVITDYAKSPYVRIANVGGAQTLDAGGNVTAVTGGVTVSEADAAPNSDTGKLTLVGITAGGSGTITDGGDITVVPGTGESTVSGGTDISNDGLLGSETAKDMNPSVVTDPIYQVEVSTVLDGSNIKHLKAEVYLSNAKTVGGTFGLYFDPKVIDTAKVTAGNTSDFSVEREAGIFYSTGYAGGVSPEVRANYNGNGYVAFAWDVGTSASAVPLDATSERKKLVTIKLPIRSEYWTEADLKKVADNRTVYTMDYAFTESGATIKANCPDDETLNEMMSSTWRNIALEGTENCIKLDDAAATRGGFYQISVDGTAHGVAQNVMQDIRMNITLPDIFEKQRAEFFITERDAVTAVDNARINLYSEKYDPNAQPAATPITTLTTENGGFAHATLDPDLSYWYTVEEGGHWAYPDGTAQTDSDNLDCDGFELNAKGASPNVNVVLQPDSTRKPTAVLNDYINPRMDPQSYHFVALTDGKTPAGTPLASITSTPRAYNSVDYFFTITPDNGKKWDTTKYATMDDVAAALVAKLFDTNKDATDGSHFQSGTPAEPDIIWKADEEQFYIAGDKITGASIGTDTVNGGAVDALRAGDVTIAMLDDMLTDADYTVNATPGIGGKVKFEPNAATGLPGHSDQPDAIDYSDQPITETLTGGRTASGTFTFQPDSKKVIDKVFINGVAIYVPDEQKKKEFSYQFSNISGNQNIYVTFVDDKGLPQSDPALTLTVGSKGAVDVLSTGMTADVDETVTGADSKNYVFAGASETSTLKLTVKPSAKYEIDTVLVNGVACDLSSSKDPNNSNYVTLPYEINDLSLEPNSVNSVVVTFKPEGKASTQAIVTANVVYGMGVLAPIGASIYPIGSTPKYAMTPYEHWTVLTAEKSESIVLNGRLDKSTDIKAPGTGETAFTYTMPSLTGNVLMDTRFAEKTAVVEGSILTHTTKNFTSKIAPATLTFVRAAVPGKYDKTTITVVSDNTVTAGGANKLLSFTANIPEGKWSVTVQKHGYLDYTVTGFEVAQNATEKIYFGDSTCAGGTVAGNASNIKPIPLIVGDASGDGLAVAFNDAAMVVAGWVQNALEKNKRMADVDESAYVPEGTAPPYASSTVDDMSCVSGSMYKTREKGKAYDVFCAAAP